MFKDKKENSTTPFLISCDLNTYKNLNISSQDCMFFFEGAIIKKILMQMFEENDYTNTKLKTDYSPIKILSTMLTNYILDEMYGNRSILGNTNHYYLNPETYGKSHQSNQTNLNYLYINEMFHYLSGFIR